MAQRPRIGRRELEREVADSRCCARPGVGQALDLDDSMLDVARAHAPELPWFRADLAQFDPALLGIAADFDLVLAAGNVLPLLAAGTEVAVVKRLAGVLRPGGLLVAGFGLDAAHLPVPPGITLAEYDESCAAVGLALVGRFATWDADAYDGGGYAVSVHRASA
ncbi:class I SAM-dependent methyltransferase [Streptomyces sp. NPDC046821]|uniref:class I SAM-dependent methyltransferase n=1 Tax=Streptomyces sp. NPDC046821 TaxID=3154702 RepID=UPI003405F56A